MYEKKVGLENKKIFKNKKNTRGIVILAGTVKIMPTLLINQMTGIFGWGI